MCSILNVRIVKLSYTLPQPMLCWWCYLSSWHVWRCSAMWHFQYIIFVSRFPTWCIDGSKAMLKIELRVHSWGCHVDIRRHRSSVWRAIWVHFRLHTPFGTYHIFTSPVPETSSAPPSLYPVIQIEQHVGDWVCGSVPKQARVTYWPKEGVSLHYIYLFLCFICQ